jgi:N-dimethylarginine dimethylaminohydrolase
MILCRMGKPQREQEPAAQGTAFAAMTPAIPVIGEIVEPGRIEGGDVVWLDDRTLVVGHGYRTNGAGIEQLRALLGDSVDEFVIVPLPHWKGESDVMHLMSLISPIDRDLVVSYSPLLPISLRKYLLRSGIDLVDVPDAEFDSMATNILALAPRHCLMLAGNPRTRAALERAGASVIEYEGEEISVKGAGGPTCLTRPITRA